jgi:hypothetical protein
MMLTMSSGSVKRSPPNRRVANRKVDEDPVAMARFRGPQAASADSEHCCAWTAA